MVSMISWMPLEACWIAMMDSRDRRSSLLPSSASRWVWLARLVERCEPSAMLLMDPDSPSITPEMADTLLEMACSRSTCVVISMANLTTL